jgi:hypothetical protein
LLISCGITVEYISITVKNLENENIPRLHPAHNRFIIGQTLSIIARTPYLSLPEKPIPYSDSF